MQEINYSSNPFPGLRPFEATETHLFFGRDGQSEDLLRRLKRTRFLAVVGTSGSGKSSLVRAGLLPALQGGLMASAGSDWRIAILRPGNDPIGNLARALASPTVLGSRDEKSGEMQEVLAETTLRRSSLGLAELVSRARTKLDEGGRPLFHDYENLLIVVDQFEEIFRFKQLIEEENSKEDAAAFVKLLLEAVRDLEGKIYVVLTMRSDFLGDCAQFRELPEAINNGQYLIPRMTRDERRAAVTGPVAVGEGSISEPLVNQLLNDVGDNPDQLPIMQHALMRTWDYWLGHRRNGDPMDIPDYNAIGGMDEALSRHADEAYEELNDAQRVIAEKLFKGLTEKGADNREIRRPMELHEVCELTGTDEASVVAVVEVFRREGRSFLMPPPTDALTDAPIPLTGESLIDISHESLIRNWSRLKKWTEEEAQSARTYKRLAETAMLHKTGEEALLIDPALQSALDWREKNKPNAAWAHRYHPEFEMAMGHLDASAAARDVEAQERERQRRKEVSYKRTRLAAFLLAFSVLLSLASAVYAFRQGAAAERERTIAVQKTGEAEKEKSVADEQRIIAEGQKAIADKNSAEAGKQRRSAEEEKAKADEQAMKANVASAQAEKERDRANQQSAIASLNAAKAEASRLEAQSERQKAEAQAAMFHRLLYAADINLAQQAYEATNVARGLELLEAHRPDGADTPDFSWYYLWRRFHGEAETLDGTQIALSLDGKVLAYGGQSFIHFMEPDSHKDLGIIQPPSGKLNSLALSPDGKLLALGISEGSVKLIDIQSRGEVGTFDGHEGAVNAVAFSPDGKLLATGSSDETVRLWDVATRREVLKLGFDEGQVGSVAFSPDSKTIAASGRDGGVRMWAIASPSAYLVSGDLCPAVALVALPGTNLLIAMGGVDGTVKLKVTETGKEFSTFTEHKVAVSFITPSSDNMLLAVGYADGAIKLLSVPSLEELATLNGHRERVNSLAFSPDSGLLVSGSDDENVKLWDIEAQIREQAPLNAHKRTVVAFSPDGKILALRNARTVSLMSADTRRELCTIVSGTDKVISVSVAFSPDGKTLATGNEFKVEPKNPGAQQADSVVLWDVGSCGKRGTLRGFNKPVESVAFSPDSRWLATASNDPTVGYPEHDPTVRLWDAASLREVKEFHVDKEPQKIVFSPDASRLAVASGDGEIKLVDVQSLKEIWSYGVDDENTPRVTSLAFSPDARILAAGFEDGSARILDTAKGEQLRTLRGHRQAIDSIAFSPDGRTLATGGGDLLVKLWDTASARELITLKGTSIAFSPDGRTLATSNYGTLRLWHAATDEEVKAQLKALDASK
jgi:WD40 repeat protein/energy-coupling factor transporter ATP-binding protein EcfA2